MIELSDLGITPEKATGPAPATAPTSTSLVPGSTLARALYEVWTGKPVVLVDSPPGAGKTSLLIDLCEHLLNRSDMSITLATPTRSGAKDVAERLIAHLTRLVPDQNRRPQVFLNVSNLQLSTYGEAHNGGNQDRRLSIRTVASCSASTPPSCDLIIFDEAYQSTFSDVLLAADSAQQILAVGDPGQIGPVVTVDTRVWEGRDEAPHFRAPEVLARRADAITLHLGASYRLGQATVDAIAPLYDFEFGSSRPDRYLLDADGARVPELAHVMLDPEASTAASSAMRVVADQAIKFIGMTFIETDHACALTPRPLTESDVAIVVPHNNQLASLVGLLTTLGHPEVVVGTADSLQGRQWPAVVSIDPLFGHSALKEFQVAPGRLCVMASRHMAAFVWASVPDWNTRMDAAVEDFGPDVARGRAVREALTATQHLG